jgi:sterol desaturase/sphingolipid hydroxylase (fatty acid hydroxylase superfamily)
MAQILGAVAVLIQVLTYQRNNRKDILFGVMSAQILFVVHFILLGGYTGAAVNAIGATRNLIFAKSKKIIKSSALLGVFLAVQLAVTILTWQGPISILALIGSWLSTLAFWQSDPRSIRRLIVFMPLFWLAYNFFIFSYVGMVSNMFVLISTLIAMYRFDFKSEKAREKIL